MLEIQKIRTFTVLELQKPMRWAFAIAGGNCEFVVLPFHCVGGQRNSTVAFLLERVSHTRMRDAEMIVVAGEVLCEKFPVRRHHVAVRARENLQSSDIL